MAEEKDKKYDDVMREAQYRKSRGIAWFNATNSAIEIVKFSSIQDPSRMKEMLTFWRNWFVAEYTKDYAENIANIGMTYNPEEAKTKLNAATSIADLMKVWVALSEDERQNVDIVKVKNELKEKYEVPQNAPAVTGVATKKKGSSNRDKSKAVNVEPEVNPAGSTV